MSRKKLQKKQISQEWLTTYSDTMTLLLTFFVLLYSFSLIDTTKFRKIAVSLQNALMGGGQQTLFEYNETTGDVPIVGEDIASNKQSLSEGENMYDTIVEFVNTNSLDKYVSIKESARGVIIEFNDRILFDTGKTEIKDEGVPVLMKIAELLDTIPNSIVIEGHTDNVPIRTSQYPSNWELSAARALKVLWYMTDNRGIDPKRCSIAAYGEYSPIASNDTPEGRMQNRRVNILIVQDNENRENNSNK